MDTISKASNKILIVDDEPLNCELLESYIELLGHESVVACNGEEAMEMLDASIDIVLLDVNMPGMTGFDVVRKIRTSTEYWDLPVIMVTALNAKEDRLRAAQAGANDFIAKPVDQVELNVRMTSLLEMKLAQDQVKLYQANLEKMVETRTAELKAANTKLEAMSTTDPVTGMPNHRLINRLIDVEVDRSDKFHREFSILYIDLDDFRTVNNELGHELGDNAIADFARFVRAEVRTMDTVGRWGGDEIYVILPEVGRQAAFETAERMRSHATRHLFDMGGATTHLTCSVGVATYPHDGIARSHMVESAERALCAAKQLGRNQVRAANDPLIPSANSEVTGCNVAADVEALALLVDARDCYTGRHTDNVAELSRAIGRAMGIADADIELIGMVGQLHDIGKVAIPDSVLRKPGPLTEEEWDLMRTHPVVGADVASRMATLRVISGAIRSHHERWDGNGYPDGLKGTEIPIAARIVTVADSFSAITTDRPYRRAKSFDWALDELKSCAGAQFDPDVVAALELVLSMREIAERLKAA
ncbi:MAG TPA: diguanylate cyclase [Capsulimonadaceae bacterium]|jgi:diguanylate cyclase (GGDEF)-like protein